MGAKIERRFPSSSESSTGTISPKSRPSFLEVDIAGTTKKDFSADTEEGRKLADKARQIIAVKYDARKNTIKLALYEEAARSVFERSLSSNPSNEEDLMIRENCPR
jgi:hypothetical protein